MDGTIITFVVPAYNSASTIRDCLDSLLKKDLLPHIEILVVNDGSTDDTASIAKEYAAIYPSIKLVNKENGGHGSAINHAAAIAKGKYFKVIDSDDKVKSDNLSKYVTCLNEASADVVLTNYRTIESQTGYVREYAMHSIDFWQTQSFDDFWSKGRGARHVCNFHGITYKTDFYRSCGTVLSEKISYEDQEYSTLPFAYVKTVHSLDLFLYEYSLGNPGQSMSDENQVKRLAHKEQVLWKLIGGMSPKLTRTAADYFMFKCGELMLGYYMAAMVKNPCRHDGRKAARKLRRQIAEKGYRQLLCKTRKAYAICLLLSWLGRFGNTALGVRRVNFFMKLAMRIRNGG